jgi:DNA-binding MarR family transcriptional regulator
MEHFALRSNDLTAEPGCAELVMLAVPAIMSAFKREMRARRPEELSVPQFRTLIFLQRHAGATVSDVAGHLGLALSTTSQLIDGLLKRQYMLREVSQRDRRCATLSLTAEGNTMLEDVRARVHAWMDERLASLTPEEREALRVAMPALNAIFRRTTECEGCPPRSATL